MGAWNRLGNKTLGGTAGLHCRPVAAKGGESFAIQAGTARTRQLAGERGQELLGQDQLVIAGMAQAIDLVAVLDQHFTLALEQGAAVDYTVSRHQLDRALRQVEGTRA